MGTLYHCFYREPTGDAILATCFREVNNVQASYLFAATHLTKALAFAFSYHDEEALLNSGIEGTDNEVVIICGGQETLDKPRHIRVFSFSDEGFTYVGGRSRQAVSPHSMPFANTTKVMDTTDINDLMRAGLQIMLLPKNLHAYYTPDEPGVVSTIWRNRDTPGDGMKAMMEQLDARWINHERKVGECALLKAQIFGAAPEGNTPKPTALSL